MADDDYDEDGAGPGEEHPDPTQRRVLAAPADTGAPESTLSAAPPAAPSFGVGVINFTTFFGLRSGGAHPKKRKLPASVKRRSIEPHLGKSNVTNMLMTEAARQHLQLRRCLAHGYARSCRCSASPKRTRCRARGVSLRRPGRH